MINYIPILFQDAVLLPGELIALQIKTEDELNLILECHKNQKKFGLLKSDLNHTIQFGTITDFEIKDSSSIQINQLIELKGTSVFKVLEHVNKEEDRLYEGAIVHHIEDEPIRITKEVKDLVIRELEGYFSLLYPHIPLTNNSKQWTSFDYAKNTILTNEQRHDLLQINNEMQRLEYLRKHLKDLYPPDQYFTNLKTQINNN